MQVLPAPHALDVTASTTADAGMGVIEARYQLAMSRARLAKAVGRPIDE